MPAYGLSPVDVEQRDIYLEFILIDKVKPKSDILQRITNLQKHGGVRMYAEVYKWFTETSGQGLMEQTALMMNPTQAAKEEDIAEAIEMWEEKGEPPGTARRGLQVARGPEESGLGKHFGRQDQGQFRALGVRQNAVLRSSFAG